jgi:chromosome segregation ATPase
MERTKAQMEASFAQRLENELNALEQSHQQRLNEVRNELDARSRASADRESLLQSDQAKQLDQMQSEMETLRQSHAAEILTLKSNMLKNSDASYKQQIDELTASFNAELERVKAAAEVGSTMMSGIDQAGIEEILNSLQGVYPPDMIQKLRQDLNAKGAELSRMNKNISDTTTQMNVLQSKLSASEQSQQSLSRTIQSLETWKQNAEKDIKAKTDQLQMARAEVSSIIVSLAFVP